MKRAAILLVILSILSASLAAPLFAQESPDPTEQAVLEAARAKYRAEQAAAAAADAQAKAAAAQAEADAAARAAQAAADAASAQAMADAAQAAQAAQADAEEDDSAPFTPFVLSFAPGLSVPFGTYDAAFAAGAIGVISRDIYGFQGGGVLAIARNIDGFQGAGIFCIADGEVSGAQGSGIFNIANGEVEGFQGSGVFNIADGGIEGFQGAGVFNIAGGDASPIQMAGVFNIAEDMEGFQMAGVFNSAGDVEGGQIAGVVNVARRVEGVQVGVVNIADSVEGLQLGLVNIAREPGLSSEGGYYEPDTDYVYAAFQAGSRHVYGVLAGGMPRSDWARSAEGIVLSYGLGSRLRLAGAYLDLDFSAASNVGPELPALGQAIADRRPPSDPSALIPYPSIRACLGVPIIGRFHLIGGFKVDVDLDAAPRVPETLKRGWSYSSELFGAGYEAWTKLYLGVKF